MSSAPAENSSNIARRRAAARCDPRDGYLERRREIVAAAAEVFKQRGLRGTTLKHVADALGTDRASLYYYVGSKEELFEEIVSEAVGVNLAAANEIRDSDGSAPEKLRRLIVRVMESYSQYYPVLYVLIQENLNHVKPERAQWAAEMRRINNAFVEVLIDIVQRGQHEGTIRQDSPAWLLAYGIMGMLGWTNRWFDPRRSQLPATEIGETFAKLVLDGLVPR